MGSIGKNIRKIRSVKGLSQSKFAEIFELKRSNIGAYEEGRANPKAETLALIANYFGIPLEKMITSELTVNDLAKFDKALEKQSSVDKNKNDSFIKYIAKGSLSSYLLNREDSKFIENLPTITFPFKGSLERAFEISIKQMEVKGSFFSEGKILLTKKLVKEKIRQDISCDLLMIQADKIFVGTYTSDGTLLTSVEDGSTIKLDSILEFWQIRGSISLELNIPHNIENRVSQLEDTIKKLNKYLNI